MLFSRNENFDKSEISFAKNFLEKLIGKSKKYCRTKAEENGFTFLDGWNGKMGFVKENENKYLILSLQFEESECSFYQLIIKEEDKQWLDGKILDYNNVRDLGLLD